MAKVYFEKLEEHLSGALAPIYMVTGDEPVQLRDACKKIRQRARHEGFDRRELRVLERGFDWGELLTLCGPSLFGEQPMLDLRLLSGKLDAIAKTQLQEWCDTHPSGSLLVLQLPRLDNRALSEAWARAIDKVGVIVRIMPLDERDTRRWLKRILSDRQLQMGDAELAYFLEHVEGNLLAAEQEADKLHILAGPGIVPMERLEELLGRDARYAGSDLVMAMLQGRPRRIVEVARNLRDEGVEPIAVHSLLLRELRQLLDLKRDSKAVERVFPFSRRDVLRQIMESRSESQLRNILYRFVRMERVLKGNSWEAPWEALQNACLAFSGKDRLTPRGGFSLRAPR